MPLSFFMDDANGTLRARERDGVRAELWEYHWEGHRIWGATAKIIREVPENAVERCFNCMENITKLLEIMAALRHPETGCPWDVEQDFASIAPYTVEEAYEVADAIERGALDELRGELGDLLLQVVFHARMAEEQGLFDFEDVAAAINEKLVRRHPHVFGDTERGHGRRHAHGLGRA